MCITCCMYSNYDVYICIAYCICYYKISKKLLNGSDARNYSLQLKLIENDDKLTWNFDNNNKLYWDFKHAEKTRVIIQETPKIMYKFCSS